MDINAFNKWNDDKRPVNKHVFGLNISNSNIYELGNLENLINLKHLDCSNNQLTSLEGTENLVKLKSLNCGNNFLTSFEVMKNLNNFQSLEYLYCHNNQLTTLECIEKLIKLIKNNPKIKNGLRYNFIDADDYVELNNLFDTFVRTNYNYNEHAICEGYNEYAFEETIIILEKMIFELNRGFQKYVLK
jgi:hypothetical protein